MQFHAKPLTRVRTWSVNSLRALCVVIIDTLLMWTERASSRRDLMKLDHRQLKDIGVSRFDAVTEAQKPFWRP